MSFRTHKPNTPSLSSRTSSAVGRPCTSSSSIADMGCAGETSPGGLATTNGFAASSLLDGYAGLPLAGNGCPARHSTAHCLTAGEGVKSSIDMCAKGRFLVFSMGVGENGSTMIF